MSSSSPRLFRRGDKPRRPPSLRALYRDFLRPRGSREYDFFMLPRGTAVWRLDGSIVLDFDGIVALQLQAALGTVGVRVPAIDVCEVRGRPIREVARSLIARFRNRPAESAEVARVEADFAARIAEHLRVGVDVREAAGATAALVALHEARIHVSLRSELPRNVVDAAVRRLRWEDLLGDVVAAEGTAEYPSPARRPGRSGFSTARV